MSDDEKPGPEGEDLGPRFGPVGGASGSPESFPPRPDSDPIKVDKLPKPKKPKVPSPFPERDEWALPERYGVDCVVALVRDPWWVFVYWELADATRAQAKEKAGAGARMVLRMSSRDGQVLAETRVPDVAVQDWYMNVSGPGLVVRAEIGFKGGDGAFHPVLASEERPMPTFAPGAMPTDILAGTAGAGGTGPTPEKVEEIYDFAGGPELTDPARLGDELRDGGFGPFVWSRGGELSGSGIGMGYRPRPAQPQPGRGPKGPGGPSSPSSPWGGPPDEGPEGGRS